jgi:translocator protein
LTALVHSQPANPKLWTTALFIALVVVGGTAIGLLNMPGDWYGSLQKPPFNPPSWIFAPVWTTLYVLIGIAGARTWAAARDAVRMKLWWLQLALNFAWSPTFFSAHSAIAALAIVTTMLVVIISFVIASWPKDRAAALLFVPYAAWVSFATLLNAAIAVLN